MNIDLTNILLEKWVTVGQAASAHEHMYKERKVETNLGSEGRWSIRTNARIMLHSARRPAWFLQGFTKHSSREVVSAMKPKSMPR